MRGHRAIEPTSACAALANTLADSFDEITPGVEALRASPWAGASWSRPSSTTAASSGSARPSLFADGQHNVVAPLKPSHALLTTLAGNWMTDALNASREPAISEQRRV